MLGAIFIFGGIGFLIGGPIGALIGLGIAIYGLLNAKKSDREENLKPKGSNIFKQEKIETVAAVNNLSIEDKIIKFNRQHRIFLDKQEDRCEIERLVKIYHFLNEHNIKCLYHFTDMRNIQSIKQTGGLYSWKESQERGIKIKRSGGNDFSKQLDTRYGLERYVRLSFCKDHPMMYVAERQRRIEFAVILQINPLVACLKSTQFSNMNATKSGHSLGDTCEFLSSIPFEVFSEDYRALSEESKNYYQAEILVNGSVPIEDILNINTVASSHEDVYKESLNGLSKIFLKGTAEFVQESANFLSKSDVWLKEFNKQLQLSKEEQERKDDELKREYLPKVQYIKNRLENFYNGIPHEYALYIDHSDFFTEDKKFISYFDNLEQKRGSELKILYDASFKTVNSEQKLLKIFRSKVENLYSEKSKQRLEWSSFKDDILYLMSIVPETNKPRILKQIDESLKFNLSVSEEIESKNILLNNKISFKYHPATKEELKKLVEDESIYLGDINTSFITDMSNLFEDTSRVNFDGIEKWNVSNVTNMLEMFYKALHFNSDISQWDVSNVTNMCGMFSGASEFDSDLSKWDVSKVTNMNSMFREAANFNSDLSEWDVSKVSAMALMFCEAAKFNSDLSKWNVSNVTNMCGMFSGASEFDSDLSKWDVSKVTNMNCMFREAANFNSDLSEWDVSKVSAMALMFCGAAKFNSDLSKWNVSKVNTMSYMFCGAAKFNSDLSKWDVSNVTDMGYMFGGASNFNSDLSQWKVVTECFILGMFDNARCMELPWWYLEKTDEYLW
ncbi:DarT ssDNA thymidine ADP-ribosyltransferase family protein [Succinatimonas hippei]|uniref:DarT ssDNA thymidine ADP-ribosyltransferase family protein n=1 Tax=Succinatimonas hippei TaxID=626938 RepID=UPI0020116ECE|nr:DarT ssDNA thymidine ADP-ribosyltransferase family protein [Succinatimonas hippei]MCL1603979.1 DarT ssDNA thymidine ADP-ribosyltransferase family protein [Succinatimonas hippei]